MYHQWTQQACQKDQSLLQVADVPCSITARIHTKLSKSKWALKKIRAQNTRGPRQGPTPGFNLLQMSPNWFLQIWILDPI